MKKIALVSTQSKALAAFNCPSGNERIPPLKIWTGKRADEPKDESRRR